MLSTPPPSPRRSGKRIHPRTPPSSSYSYLPTHIVDINLNDLIRRITLKAIPQQRSDLDDHRSPLLQLSILPPEILAEIFIQCLPHDSSFLVPNRTEAPLLLTRVSSYWRQLALATPELWSSLHINYKDPQEDIPATQLWLVRSGSLPLSLSIAIDFNEQPHQDILDVLCRYSFRWKHIRFDFRHLLCPPMYSLHLAQDRIPQLSTFEFHARDISNPNLSQITRLLSSAPQLREVTWVDDLANTETLLELPLNRLTRLSLAMEHGTLDYLQLLHQCSNLEHIRIARPLSNNNNNNIQNPGIYLSKLATLNISYDLTSILDHLILPSLHSVRIYIENDTKHLSNASSPQQPPSLYLNAPHAQSHPHLPLHPASSANSTPQPPSWNPSPFLSLIDRSACQIKHLSINAPLIEENLLLCLKKTSESLVCLELKGGVGVVGDKLMEALTVRLLCPKLEELSLDAIVACSQGALAGMVESRLCSSLRKIRLLDGHRDLEKLEDLSKRRRETESLTIDIIPRKTARQHTRGFLFRRKLCASR